MKAVYKCICMLLGAFIGSGCSGGSESVSPEYGPPQPITEYGVPYATYILSGSVSDENDQPIPGIGIRIRDSYYGDHYPVYSDESGEWELTEYLSELCQSSEEGCNLEVNDVDGEENGGTFADQTIQLNLEQTEEASDWHLGTFAQDDIAVELSEASPPDES